MDLSSAPRFVARGYAALESGVLALRGGGSLGTLKVAAIGAVFLGGALFVLACLDPTSMVRRSTDDYARGLDDRLRVLRKKPHGARIAALQAVAMLGVVAVAVQLAKPQVALLAVLVAAGPSVYLKVAVVRRRAAIEESVHGFALNLANAMRTTGNIGDSIRTASKITGGPLGEEIEQMLAQMRLGGSLEDALEDLAKRGNALALDVLVSALLIGRKTGGDLPQLMEATASSLREIHRLEAMAAKMMADPKHSFLMMASSIPLGFFGLKLLMPMVVDPFLATPKGQSVLVTCVIAFAFAALAGWKIVKVDV